jgi:hypothetical protein
MNRQDQKSLLRTLTSSHPGADDMAKVQELLQTRAREMHIDDLYQALDETDRLLNSFEQGGALPEGVCEQLRTINYAALREIQDRMRAS